MAIGDYYNANRFKENKDGRFDESTLNGINYGVDKYLNSCTIKNGIVTRKYDCNAELPAYVDTGYVMPKTGGFHFIKLEEREQTVNNVYKNGPDNRAEKLGIINKNGEFEGSAISLEDNLFDNYGYDLSFTTDGHVFGHEGPIFTYDGKRFFINKYNQVDVVQTKLYLLFDHVASLASKIGEDFEEKSITPYIPEDDEYDYRFNYLYLESLFGLDVCYSYNEYNNSDSLGISIGGITLAQLEKKMYPDAGIVHGVMLINNKYVDVTKIEDIDALNKTIDDILSRAKNFFVDYKKTFESDNNVFMVGSERYTSLEKLQEGKTPRKL